MTLNSFDVPADFETAIKATGFGKFNIFLLLAVIPYSFTQIFESNSTSYILPIAECDLKLTLENKGQLIAANYGGMIISGFIWSYFSDTIGRRKVIMIGCSINFCCYIFAAFSQNVLMLIIAKLMSGFAYTGPMTAVASYLTEFHSTKRRAKIQIFRGFAGAIALICLPMIAWAILPTSRNFFLGERFALHSWNIFLIICSFAPATTAIIFTFMPESPRFLMSRGRSKEALEVFKFVHKLNTGKDDNYPVKCLVEEKRNQENGELEVNDGKPKKKTILNQFLEVKPLFCKPHFLIFILTGMNFISLSIGTFVLKIWYPQILQGINDYTDEYGSKGISVCKVFDILVNKNMSHSQNCTVNLDNSYVYINSAIFGSVELLMFLVGVVAVNKLGKKTLVLCVTLATSVCPFLLYFFHNAMVMMALFPIIISFGELGTNVMMTTTLELFPTVLRMTALNLQLIGVRAGLATGNIVFPYLMMAGCIPLLVFVTVFIFIPVILTSLLPSTENKALQ